MEPIPLDDVPKSGLAGFFRQRKGPFMPYASRQGRIDCGWAVSAAKTAIGEKSGRAAKAYAYNAPFCAFRENEIRWMATNHLCHHDEGYERTGPCRHCPHGLFCNRFAQGLPKILASPRADAGKISRHEVIVRMGAVARAPSSAGVDLGKISFGTNQKLFEELMSGDIPDTNLRFLDNLTIHEQIPKRSMPYAFLANRTNLRFRDERMEELFMELIDKTGINFALVIKEDVGLTRDFHAEDVLVRVRWGRPPVTTCPSWISPYTRRHPAQKELSTGKRCAMGTSRKAARAIHTARDFAHESGGIHMGKDVFSGKGLGRFAALPLTGDGGGWQRAREFLGKGIFGIPVITDLQDIMLDVRNGTPIRIDASAGEMWVRPKKARETLG